MKIAIFESIITPGGHEIDFDRILVEELTKLRHDVSFMVPQNFEFKFDYRVPVRRLPGNAVSYTGLKGFRKIIASLKREINRQRWYKNIYEQTLCQDVDAVIVPTSTYRYLRALNINKLKNSPKPIIFILHGINPGEAPKFLSEMEKLKQHSNIKAAVISLSDNIFGVSPPNTFCLAPPTYLPWDIEEPLTSPEKPGEQTPLKLGFFGQYRREKKLDDFLDVFVKGNYRRKIKLFVQGATMNPDDKLDFERIIKKYGQYDNIEFLHKGLIGIEWQRQIASIDVLLMPYSASRYRYHWGGMLFTAIGYKKPVIMSDEINPEVIAKYKIGLTFKSNNLESLQKTVENFINTYDENYLEYTQELDRAYEDYHPSRFAGKLAGLIY